MNIPYEWGEEPETEEAKECGECGYTPCYDPERCRFMLLADREYERKGDR